jgi:hypothetical protein
MEVYRDLKRKELQELYATHHSRGGQKGIGMWNVFLHERFEMETPEYKREVEEKTLSEAAAWRQEQHQPESSLTTAKCVVLLCGFAAHYTNHIVLQSLARTSG